jgi:hypothetical protein
VASLVSGCRCSTFVMAKRVGTVEHGRSAVTRRIQLGRRIFGGRGVGARSLSAWATSVFGPEDRNSIEHLANPFPEDAG